MESERAHRSMEWCMERELERIVDSICVDEIEGKAALKYLRLWVVFWMENHANVYLGSTSSIE